MHRITLALALFLAPLAQLAGVTITSAYTRFYEDGEIRPIRDYFGAALTGQGFRTVIASHADSPAGQYFIIRLKDAKSAAPAAARMTYYASASKDAATFTWDLAGATMKKWLYLGLTGPDWPSEDVQPLAWRIELLDASGGLIAEWKSFLWEMP